MDNNVGVRITATSDVGPGVQQTKSQLGGLEGFVSTLNATFSRMGAQMREAFMGGASSAEKMTGAIKQTEAATISETAALSAMIAKVHEGAESVRTFQMRAKEFAEVYVAMFAIEQVAEFINKMAEMSEKVEHLSQQFGMSVAQVQKLQGVATATGIPVDSLTRGMGLLDRNMATAAAGSKRMQQAFTAVGVSLNDGRDQMQKLEAVADKFQHMEDGPKKAALAMQLFGRSGRDLIPVLNLGSSGIEALNAKLGEYGVVNEDAVAKGVALAESTNETKLGFMGMWNVLTDSLAPAFKMLVDGVNSMIQAFVQSYQSGGLIYVLFQGIAAAIEIVVAVIEGLATVFKAVWDVIVDILTDIWHDFQDIFGASVPENVNVTDQILNVFKDTCVFVGAAVKMFVDLVSLGFRSIAQVVVTACKIASDAMSFNWGAIAGDWQNGMNRLVNIVNDGTRKVIDDANKMAAALAAASAGKAMGGETGVKLPKASMDFDFTPSPTGGGKKKHEKKDHDKASEMQLWKQELSDKLLLEENWGVDENAFSEKFWEQKLALVKKGSKEEIEIRRMINGEKKALFKEEQQAEIASLKQTETLRLSDSKTQISLQKEALNAQIDNINQREKLGQLSEVRAVAERNRVNRQLLQLDLQEANEEYQIKLRTLQQELLLEHLKPAERAKINNEIIVLQRQHDNQMLQLNAQFNAKIKAQNAAVVDAYVAKWKGIVSPITSALGGMFQALYNRQMTFKQAAIQAMDSIVMSWAQKGIEALGNWIATQLGMRAANTATKTADSTETMATNAAKLISTQTTNMGQIMSEAPVASAAAFASTAAIPIVGPALAPGAAAAAFGAVMSMAPLAFAEQGFDIPHGSNPLTQLHQEEMVLPAHLANPLRDMLSQPFMLRAQDSGARAGRDAGEAGRTTFNDNSRGDVHLHHSPSYPAPDRDVDMDTLLKSEGDRLVRFLKKQQRDGRF